MIYASPAFVLGACILQHIKQEHRLFEGLFLFNCAPGISFRAVSCKALLFTT